jgi:hypothetical protein
MTAAAAGRYYLRIRNLPEGHDLSPYALNFARGAMPEFSASLIERFESRIMSGRRVP